MKASAEKSSVTASKTAARPASQPFFAKAGGGNFFAPAGRTAAPSVQMKMTVGKTGDKFEREADKMADKVMRMPSPASSAKEEKIQRKADEKLQKKENEKLQKAPAEEKIQKKEDDTIRKVPAREDKLQRKGNDAAPSVSPTMQSAIRSKTSGGQPLSADVRRDMESRFNADFSKVRIHSNAEAAGLSNQLSARAFTHQNHIFFSRNQYQPGTSAGKQLLAHELTHTIQQGHAVQRSPQVSTTVTPPPIQRLGIRDALDYFAEHANIIPGFRMFTIILGINPINMSRVERSAANILRALVEFLPGGALITQALDNHGIFDRIGGWVEQQVQSLGMTGSVIRKAIDEFLDSLGWSDIFDLGGVWERAKRIVTEPIDRIISFGRSLVAGIIQFIKDAILRPLAQLAAQTRGWDLLCAVLGRNPITGEAVPRNAETLIGGFMKLIGQEEVWQNIQRGNAVARAWAWFQGALSGVMAFVQQIPSLFLNALRSLEIADIVLVPRALARVAGVFANFAGQFFSWAGQQVMGLLQIIFEVVAPGAMPYIRRAAGAFRTIIQNPVGFVGNLVRAGIQGFRQFAGNFLTHLRTALIGWITGAMSGAGVYIPQAFTLQEIIKFILSVLGLTWQNIRQKLVRVIGEPAVAALETGFDIVVTLVREGPAAAWQKIMEAVGNLRDMVMGQVMNFVQTNIVQAAVTRLVSSLNPAGAFIQAIIATYNTIMFLVERLQQISQVAMSLIDSIAAIASGSLGAAANRVEQTMAGMLTLVISFLARLVGLGNVSQAVTNIINRVRQPIDRALDRVVEWIVATARRLGRGIAQAGVPQDPNERLRLASQAAVATARRLSGRVTRRLLIPVLAGIRMRYGLRSIEPFERNGSWWVRAEINPIVEDNLSVDANAEDIDVMQSIRLRLTRRQVVVLRVVREVAEELLERNIPAARAVAGNIQSQARHQVVNVSQDISIPALAQSIEERGAPAGLHWTYRYSTMATPSQDHSTTPRSTDVNVLERYGMRRRLEPNSEGRFPYTEGEAYTFRAGGRGDYRSILESLHHLGLNDQDIASAMNTFALTRELPPQLRLARQRQQFTSLFHLLFVRETARSRANIVIAPMMSELIEVGSLDYRDVLRETGGRLPRGGGPYPASMDGAAAATRRLDEQLRFAPRQRGEAGGRAEAEELARREYDVVETWLREHIRVRAELDGRHRNPNDTWIDTELDRMLNNRAELRRFMAAQMRNFYHV